MANGIRVAKATKESIDNFHDLLNEISQLSKDLSHFYFLDVDWTDYEILSNFGADDIGGFLQVLVGRLSTTHYEKMLMNLTTLLDNCADEELTYLDFNPKIQKAFETHDNIMKIANNDEERKAALLKTVELIQSGYGGVNILGDIVDRREVKDALPLQENAAFGTPKPKNVD